MCDDDFDWDYKFHKAARRGYLDEMRELAAKVDVDAWDGGETALIRAVKAGRNESAYLLVSELGARVDVRDSDGRTALHWAAEKGNSTMVSFLGEEGAKVGEEDGDGASALHLAAKAGDLRTVEVLVEDLHAELEAKDKGGLTPLMNAVINGDRKIVEFLLKQRADVQAQSNNGETAETLAKANDHAALLEVIQRYKEKPQLLHSLRLLEPFGADDAEVHVELLKLSGEKWSSGKLKSNMTGRKLQDRLEACFPRAKADLVLPDGRLLRDLGEETLGHALRPAADASAASGSGASAGQEP